jgi:hypothetical protein
MAEVVELSDPAGAHVEAADAAWDGKVAATVQELKLTPGSGLLTLWPTRGR